MASIGKERGVKSHSLPPMLFNSSTNQTLFNFVSQNTKQDMSLSSAEIDALHDSLQKPNPRPSLCETRWNKKHPNPFQSLIKQKIKNTVVQDEIQLPLKTQEDDTEMEISDKEEEFQFSSTEEEEAEVGVDMPQGSFFEGKSSNCSSINNSNKNKVPFSDELFSNDQFLLALNVVTIQKELHPKYLRHLKSCNPSLTNYNAEQILNALVGETFYKRLGKMKWQDLFHKIFDIKAGAVVLSRLQQTSPEQAKKLQRLFSENEISV